MNRTFIAIYHDKSLHYTLCYDYQKNEFFKIEERKQNHTVTMLSAFTGVVFYSFFKDFEFNIGFIDPLIIVVISIAIGCIIGLLGIMLMWKVMKKNLNKNKVIVTLTQDEISLFVSKGRLEIKTVRYLLMFLVPFTLLASIFILIMPSNAIVIVCNTLLYSVLIVFIWAVRPIKRKKIYNELISGVTK